MLTDPQYLMLKADIAKNPEWVALPKNSDSAYEIAAAYNLLAVPNYWVWRTAVPRIDVYNNTSDVGTTWDWTLYKNQNISEQNAWVQMFMNDMANFAMLNLRVGIGKIFTAAASVNRDHSLAIGRRLAKRIEKLLAVAVVNPPANSGNAPADPRGNTTNPDVMTFEGDLPYQDVEKARNL